MFGAVTFRRCRMKKEGHSSFLPLDLCLGLEARSHLSSQVKEKIAQLCTKQTFRASAEVFNALMPFSISHLTAHHVVQEIRTVKAQQRWLAQSNHCFEEAVRSDIEANTSPFIPEYPGLVRAILNHSPKQSSCGAHQGTIPSEVSSSMVGKCCHTFC